jgi:hypothetical protein
MKNPESQNAITPEVIAKFRNDYLDAKRRLQSIEDDYAAAHNGRRYPGSPLVTNTSLADVARDFILQEGHDLTFLQIKSMFVRYRVQFDEGNLKKALKQAIKGPALKRTNSRDPFKKIEDEDVFDVKTQK